MSADPEAIQSRGGADFMTKIVMSPRIAFGTFVLLGLCLTLVFDAYAKGKGVAKGKRSYASALVQEKWRRSLRRERRSKCLRGNISLLLREDQFPWNQRPLCRFLKKEALFLISVSIVTLSAVKAN